MGGRGINSVPGRVFSKQESTIRHLCFQDAGEGPRSGERLPEVFSQERPSIESGFKPCPDETGCGLLVFGLPSLYGALEQRRAAHFPFDGANPYRLGLFVFIKECVKRHRNRPGVFFVPEKSIQDAKCRIRNMVMSVLFVYDRTTGVAKMAKLINTQEYRQNI
jgi:hypothetical protein